MGIDTVVQQNDVGVGINVTIVGNDGSTPLDVSAYTNFLVFISRSDGSLVSGVPGFVTDGTNGQVQYVTQPGDLSVAGITKFQLEYMDGGKLRHTQKGIFKIDPNLPGVY